MSEPDFVLEISRTGGEWVLASEMFKWIPDHFGPDRRTAEEYMHFAKGKKLVLADGTIQSRIRDRNEKPLEEVPVPDEEPEKKAVAVAEEDVPF